MRLLLLLSKALTNVPVAQYPSQPQVLDSLEACPRRNDPRLTIGTFIFGNSVAIHLGNTLPILPVHLLHCIDSSAQRFPTPGLF
ncbi:hypothetical protein DFP73DRAFT_542504 [Morchella snyderi]|nr:hypothetical protein DFP73DRAFT_542504 [Morchella snyderi]